MKKFYFLLLLFVGIELTAQTDAFFIHVDQFGYATEAEKVAVISDPQNGYNASLSFTPSATLSIVDQQTDQVVYQTAPQAWNNGALHASSGDKGWWLDFSAVQTPGDYYILDPVSGERSAVFTISDNPYSDLLKQAGRMFFYNRCNFPKEAPYAAPNWTDEISFTNPLQDHNARYIYDQGNPLLERDVSGGWFDAGDYNKYVSFTYTVIHDLFLAFENNPSVFTDNWNIPESGNGIPDIIDELVWELQWLEKMQNGDGSVHIKAGSRNHSENSLSPPSVNNHGRYYGPICSSASIVLASMFAHASIVLGNFEEFQDYANTLRQKAITSYNYAIPFFEDNTFELNCDDGSIVAGDADLDADKQRTILIEAAIYLFEATGDQTYNSFVIDNYSTASIFASNYINHYSLNTIDAFFRYLDHPDAGTVVQDAFYSLINTAVSNNWEGFYGFNEADLYRAFIPDYSYHWGSNNAIADLANLNLQLAKYNILSDSLNYRTKAKEQVHYFHGVNPQSLVYLSNMYDFGAERSVNEIYHTWFNDGTVYDHALNSEKGPAPGYVVGGANANFSYTSLSPPSNQPPQKAFLDFNDGWPESSWEITEPAIYYQSSYIRLLSNFVEQGELVGIKELQARNTLQVFPNPTTSSISLEVDPTLIGADFYIIDISGRKVHSGVISSTLQPVDVAGFAPGTYFIQLEKYGNLAVKFIKQ